jgi:hypothetical protein
MNRTSAEIAEKVWEDTHAQALLFAQKLAITKYELSLAKQPSVMFADRLEVCAQDGFASEYNEPDSSNPGRSIFL